jgi:hypothetical protein
MGVTKYVSSAAPAYSGSAVVFVAAASRRIEAF